MGFSIDYDFGILGWLVIAAMVAAGGIVLIWFVSAAREARDETVAEDVDHTGPEL